MEQEKYTSRPIYRQMKEYLDYCQYTRRMSPMTIRSKSHTFRHFIMESGVDDLQKLDNAAFNQWMAKQTERGVCARTINTRMANILSMLRYFREMGMNMPIKLPLVLKLKPNKARRIFYTEEQINEALKFADEMAWLLIRIGFDSGLRLSEITNLELSNFCERRITFIGKGSKARESYIRQDTQQHLNRYIRKNRIEQHLWVNGKGTKYCTDQIRLKMKKPFIMAGYPEFYPHALRHSFGTDIQKKGADLLEMQQMLGHSNAETTQRYIHGLDGQLENIFMKYR